MDPEVAGNAEAYNVGTTVPLLICGTIGNILTICVLQRKAFTNSKTSLSTFRVFLGALAVADIISLWLDQITLSMFYLYRHSPVNLWECRTHVFSFGTASICSSWTLVLVTIERVLIVYKPLKVKAMFTYRRAVGVTVLAWLIIATGVAIFAIIANDKDICQNTDTQLGTFVAFYAFAPAAIIIICNILIIVKVQRANKKRQQMTQGLPALKNDRFTRMLIINSFAFVLLTIPGFLLLLIHESRPMPLFVRQIAEFIKRLNHAINPVLYCVSAATFRKELKNMMKAVLCGSSCRKPPQETPETGGVAGDEIDPGGTHLATISQTDLVLDIGK